MTGLFFFFTVLAGAIIIGTAAAFAWLFATLKWDVLDDDQIQFGRTPVYASGWDWAKAKLKQRPRMLTYRRDNLGRFRRHRR